ncbi:hypothetical protein GOP47_0004642 [Adiantum capillus-veneris]|uniref:RRM domain-containing protein n=1 Tax=Adiantum capillus-veneris TaxID=13818 RepID=A0A9D4ZN02_ADICA|nr:hypothetical protein GOP47_0004642 [Adiantum capillus-veneris]
MGPAAEPSSSEKKPSPSNAPSEYQKFEEKVKRCLMLEDVTPQATIPMVQTALGQFGTVVSIDIINDPLDPKHAAKRVIVEMKTPREASHAVKEIREHPFMIKGVPRPVRALHAVATMFPDRPQKPSSGTKRTCEWVKPGDPEWEKYNEFKQLAKKHAQELTYLMEVIRKEEEKLAQEQEEKVRENVKKLDEIHLCVKDRVVHRLSRYYGMKFEGD